MARDVAGVRRRCHDGVLQRSVRGGPGGRQAPSSPSRPPIRVSSAGSPACRTRCAGATCSSSTAACHLATAPDDLGVTTDEHLWIRSGFFDTPWDAPDFSAYRAAGIERVVFGHTPQWSGPTLYHEGRSLGIDTNAVGNPRMPAEAVQELTLLGLWGDGSFERAHLVRIPTADAPDRMRRRHERDG